MQSCDVYCSFPSSLQFFSWVSHTVDIQCYIYLQRFVTVLEVKSTERDTEQTRMAQLHGELFMLRFQTWLVFSSTWTMGWTDKTRLGLENLQHLGISCRCVNLPSHWCSCISGCLISRDAFTWPFICRGQKYWRKKDLSISSITLLTIKG